MVMRLPMSYTSLNALLVWSRCGLGIVALRGNVTPWFHIKPSVDQSTAKSDGHSVGARACIQLSEDVPHMRLHRLPGDEEMVGNLRIGESIGNQLQDLGLSVGQSLGNRRGFFPLRLPPR